MRGAIFLVLGLTACSNQGPGEQAADAAPTADAPSIDAVPHGTVACAPTCNAATGACGPLLACTADNPCDTPAGPLATPLTTPLCHTTEAARPTFDDGAPVTWSGVAGDPRAACVHVPASATVANKFPLLVFLHGSHGSADDLYNFTSLRSKADTFELATGRTGFAIAAMQGRNLHWLGPNPASSHHDNLFRDLGSPSANPDVADLDHLIDTLVAAGTIDPARIYVAGWSNGAFFATLYAIARFETPTPGGNHVAAVLSFAGADPFADPTGDDASCQLATYPTSQVPTMLVHRSCDALVPCSADQAAKFGVVPGYAVEPWRDRMTASRSDPDPSLVDMIMNAQGTLVTSCTAASLCTEVIGAANHLRWPDGVADGSGLDREPAMLTFLRNHPHP